MTDQERIQALEGQVATLNSSVDLLRTQVANLMSFPVYQVPKESTSLSIDGRLIGSTVTEFTAASCKT